MPNDTSKDELVLKNRLEYAKRYLELGWSLLPMQFVMNEKGEITKKPMVEWKMYQTTPPTLGVVEAWIKNKWMLGLITGKVSNIVVVDDDRIKHGLTEYGIKSAVSVETKSGGKHYYFRYDDGVKNTANPDVYLDIRGEGGYVVLPPFNHYKWLGAPTKENLENLTTIPDELKKIIYKTSDGKATSGEPFSISTVVGMDVGGRDNGMLKFAVSECRKHRPEEWGAVFVLMRGVNNTFKEPLHENDLLRLFGQAKRYAAKSIQENGNRTHVVPVAKIIGDPRSMGDVAKERKYERELEKGAPGTGYKQLDELITGFIPGHLYTFTGETNIGKSSMACNFAYRVSTQYNQKVLYYALEPENTVVDYFASIRTNKQFKDVTDEDISYDDPNIKIYGKEQISTTADLLESLQSQKEHYGLVIIDHIGYFRTKERENVFQGQADLLQGIVGAAKAQKMAILIIAHPKKRDSKNRNKMMTEDDISGSASFKQDSTEVLIMTRDVKYKDEAKKDGGFSWLPTGKLFVAKTKAGMNGIVDLFFSDRKAIIVTPEEQRYGMFNGKGVEYNANF